MTAQLKIDQAGLSAGVAGKARTDGKADGSAVTLTNTGSGATTRFQLLWTPPGDVDAVDSLAATEEDPKVWTFDPTPARYGTYECELIENEGLTSEKRERRALVVRTPYLGLVVPALNERGDKSASLVAPGTAVDVDNNSTDDPDDDLAALGYAGWWRSQHALITALDALAAPIRVTHYHNNAGGAVTRTAYGSFAAAFAASYPSSFPSVAVYDIEPSVLDPDVGPHTLDTIVTYVLRATRGRGSVSLPELTLQGMTRIEQCTIGLPLTGGFLSANDCHVTAALSHDEIEAVTTTFGASIATGGNARFERCAFGAGVTVTSAAPSDGVVTFVDCTFDPASPPSVVFSDGAGVVLMDARSKFLWDAATGAVTNGTITVQAPP